MEVDCIYKDIIMKIIFSLAIFLVSPYLTASNLNILNNTPKFNLIEHAYYQPNQINSGWIKGVEEGQKARRRNIRIMQLRADRVKELTIQCSKIEKNWGTATPRQKVKCTAIKKFNNNVAPISDEVLFGP